MGQAEYFYYEEFVMNLNQIGRGLKRKCMYRETEKRSEW